MGRALFLERKEKKTLRMIREIVAAGRHLARNCFVVRCHRCGLGLANERSHG